MCVGATGYAEQLTGNINQTRKNVDELFGWNQDKKQASSTTNITNYYGSSGPKGEASKTPNRTALKSGGKSSGGYG
tara:strand:- start:225 stop:452 length:228 start_codon:yes stop_codon:yes gene_type:complete